MSEVQIREHVWACDRSSYRPSHSCMSCLCNRVSDRPTHAYGVRATECAITPRTHTRCCPPGRPWKLGPRLVALALHHPSLPLASPCGRGSCLGRHPPRHCPGTNMDTHRRAPLLISLARVKFAGYCCLFVSHECGLLSAVTHRSSTSPGSFAALGCIC